MTVHLSYAYTIEEINSILEETSFRLMVVIMLLYNMQMGIPSPEMI